MKWNKPAALLLLVVFLVTACGRRREEDLPVLLPKRPAWETGQTASPGQFAADGYAQESMARRCAEIAALYRTLYEEAEKTESENPWKAPELSRSAIDAVEALLMEAGLDVVDTDGLCPDYLTTADRFRGFLDAAGRNESARQEVITVNTAGTLILQLFVCQDGEIYVHRMLYPPEGTQAPDYEALLIRDWALTEKGNFYYRTYPAGNSHYIDYSLIRLMPPDRELWALNRRYLAAGDYLAANLFLTDWTENDWGELSLNDLWECLYYDTFGRQFSADGYAMDRETGCRLIPAEAFEAVVRPYFRMDLQIFRQLAQYREAEDSYPWRQLETDDCIFLEFYAITPEVTACRTNPDGTLTLTVEVLSPDLKTDCLFAHEITVRPLETGGFQYTGNRVTFQTEEYGLPFCRPRLTWGRGGEGEAPHR